MTKWKDEVDWIPNWKCPLAFFFWPKTPVTLDPVQITGRKRLPTMFSQFMEIGPEFASRILDSVPSQARKDAWVRIREEIDVSFDDGEADIADIKATDLAETTKQALIDARRGQGRFRTQLMTQWNNAYAVTGCGQQQLLRASHIRPWKLSSNKERLNPRNGLPLTANLDALFDRGLISFQSSGEMLVSKQVTVETCRLLGLPAFLDYHRKEKVLK